MTHPHEPDIHHHGRDMRIEDPIQRTMVEWLHRCVPLPPLGPFWTAVNASPVKLTERQAANQKRMGQKAGIPDLIFCWRGQFVGAEVKPPKRYLSKVQRKVHPEIILAGGVVTTVHSIDELQAFLLGLGVPIRGRLAA